MSQPNTNDLWKKQHGKLVRSTFKKAIISNVNAAANTADVYFAENPATVIRSIPLASQITASQVMVGDRCRVDVFDETNPNDMVVAYIYGRVLPTTAPVLFNSGTVNISNGGTNSITQIHGLVDANGNGVIPDISFMWGEAYYGVSGREYFVSSVGATAPDATNIYGTRTPDNTIGLTYYWFAMKFN